MRRTMDNQKLAELLFPEVVNTPEYFVAVNDLKNIEVLYLDDFFKVEQGKLPTQSDVNIAWEILNFRYNKNLKTIISTELLLADIENIDESTAGRIIEKATREFCVNIGKDKSWFQNKFLKIFKDDLTQKSTVSPDPRIFKNLKKS